MRVAVAAPSSPYKGLASFEDSEIDALLFFGRERDAEVIAANVAASRLTVLYGPSGVGKSSVLRAGAARLLRALPDVAVVVHARWSDDPPEAIRRAVAVDGLSPAPAGLSLADALDAWTRAHDLDLLLLLDQFEELFAYHAARNGGGSVAAELGEVVSRPGLRVNVLLAVREDALSTLDVLTGRVPNVFGNHLRLEHLDREAGRAAIVGPLERWSRLAGAGRVEIEEPLVEAVLDGAAGADGVEAPYLQLVMQRVWEVERAAHSDVIRLETLERLGGPAAVVREHLGSALDALDAPGRDVAAGVFHHLVTPSGTKVAHGVEDLAEYAGFAPDALAPVLDELGRRRILRPLDGGKYEIFHDVLADPVLSWRDAHAAEARLEQERRRQRRLLAAVVASVALLLVMTAVAAFALTQRAAAREQARTAEARAFAAGAWANLESDPELAMLLALEAARREPSADAEDVLRRSLERSRLRGVVPATAAPAEIRDDRLADTGGGVSARAAGRQVEVERAGGVVHRLLHPARVRAVDVAADGRRVLTAAGDSAYLWDTATGGLAARLDGHTADVVDAELSPDGAVIATASIDSTARVWDGASGGSLDILFGHDNFLTALAFSPDGQTLATAARDGTARLWESFSGRPLGILAGHGGVVSEVAFADGGELVVTLADDGTLRRWDGLPEPTLLPTEQQPPPVALTARAASGRRAVAEGAEVRLAGGGTADRVLRGHTLDVTSVEFSSDGRFLVTASSDKDARIWDAATGAHVRLLRRHFGPVAGASFSPDGRWVVTAGPIKAGLWEAATGRFLFYLRGHAANLTAAAFAADGRTILTADRSGRTMAWRCDVCGGVDELLPLAERRLAAAGRALTAAERARYAP